MEKALFRPREISFCAENYWRMFRSRGIRLPITYFFEAQLFDLIHGTDTHNWIPKEIYDDRPENFEHGGLYMCSWTKEIRSAFNILRHMLGPEFEEYCFVDLGCGKGKVVLCWAIELRKRGLKQRLLGVEYYKPLIDVATWNQRVLGFTGDISFKHGDATEIDYSRIGQKIIIFLYNPFNEVIFENVLSRLDQVRPVIVYSNPVHADLACSLGYKVIWKKEDWHPNGNTLILSRSND
jgi:SAM-dependent methyltransferase